MRTLELYAGLGGLAAGISDFGWGEIVAALDISPHVVATYNANWDSVSKQTDLLSVSVDDFAAYEADLWWMSPPCAPYTRRGNKLDLEDHRAASFLHVLDAAGKVRPRYLALENVEGFAESRARALLAETLSGYSLDEMVLCPTELGVPNKRPRYYMVASRDDELRPRATEPAPMRDWRTYVEDEVDERYRVPDRIVEKYGSGFHVMDADETYTTCFTGSYGKSWNFTGSYLRLPDGGLRQFTPREVLRFLHFPEDYAFPEEFSERQKWKYAGNSLSAICVRHVLSVISE